MRDQSRIPVLLRRVRRVLWRLRMTNTLRHPTSSLSADALSSIKRNQLLGYVRDDFVSTPMFGTAATNGQTTNSATEMAQRNGIEVPSVRRHLQGKEH